MRQRKLLSHNLLQCQPRTCMALTHQGMALHTLTAQYLCSQYAMAYIGLRTRTGDSRSIHPYNTDIVQHGSLFDKHLISPQFRMLTSYLQSLIRYSSTMSHQDM